MNRMNKICSKKWAGTIAMLLTVSAATGVAFADDRTSARPSGSPSELLTQKTVSADTIKAQPLRGSSGTRVGVPTLLAAPVEPTQVPTLLARPDQMSNVEPGNQGMPMSDAGRNTATPTSSGDDWLVPEQPKLTANASPLPPQSQASAQIVPEGMVALGDGLRPVQPGYTMGTDRTPWTGERPAAQAAAWGVKPTVTNYGWPSRSTQYRRAMVPYAGYYNPVVGYSGYQAGYAGRPPSTVPFNGGLHYSQSAFYSVPNMVVPVYPVYPVAYRPYRPVYPAPACGVGYVGAQSSSTSISVSVGARF